MAAIRVTNQSTRAELEALIAAERAKLLRMPEHWVERRAAIHARLDAMLDDWQAAPQ